MLLLSVFIGSINPVKCISLLWLLNDCTRSFNKGAILLKPTQTSYLDFKYLIQRQAVKVRVILIHLLLFFHQASGQPKDHPGSKPSSSKSVGGDCFISYFAGGTRNAGKMAAPPAGGLKEQLRAVWSNQVRSACFSIFLKAGQ